MISHYSYNSLLPSKQYFWVLPIPLISLWGFVLFILGSVSLSNSSFNIGSKLDFFLKYIIKWDYEKYPKNTPTLKYFDPENAKNVDIEDEKKELVKRLEMVNKYNQKFIVNPMHGKVTNEIFKEVVRGHTSFHLKQFGVL